MKKNQVLVVDNHPVILKMMTKLLETKGYQVLTAEDGLSALSILKTQIPNVIFIDLIMPNISGEKLCRIIRTMPDFDDTYIIILSAIAAEEDVAFSDFGANACIAKGPFDKMKEHIYDVLNHIDQDTSNGLERRVIGLEDVFQRDITKELLASKTHCEVILSRISEGILELTAGGEIVYANPSALSLTGIAEQELLTSSLSELFHEDHRQEIADLLRRLEDVPQAISEASPVKLNGKEVAVDFIPVKDEWSRTVIVILRDVSERKRAKEALLKSEQQFRSLSENAPDIIYTLDLDGSFTYVNPAWEQVLGYRTEEVLGKNFRHFARQKDEKEYIRNLERITNRKETVRDVTTTLIHKDGSARRLTLSGAPNLDPDGKTTGIVGLLKDITEQERLQTQLQQAEKMEAIGTLAGGVAHDLNNILGGLVSYPELLLMQIPDDSPLKKSVLAIKKSGDKVAAVVQDLLTLTRRRTAATEVLNLKDIVSDYLQSLEYDKLKSYHDEVEVEVHLEADLLNILGSPVHLSKTVMNLVSNAAEAMPDGGKVVISTENRYVDKPIRGYDDVEEGDYVTLVVSDTGVGISSKDIKRIFEPFYTKKAMGRSGTGLGMAVVWATVKDHKGYIDVQSAEGKGTTFTLYFPVTRQALSQDEPKLSIEHYMGKGESILVVDDVAEQRVIASEILTNNLGYSSTSVSSGEEAVKYMKTQSVDLLILDMILDGGIDGLETYKRILQLRPHQKAVIASGFSETERVKEAQRLGAGAYVKKPYSLEKIGLAVRTELDK
jgi:PAS domain S-box-containing protein